MYISIQNYETTEKYEKDDQLFLNQGNGNVTSSEKYSKIPTAMVYRAPSKDYPTMVISVDTMSEPLRRVLKVVKDDLLKEMMIVDVRSKNIDYLVSLKNNEDLIIPG